MGGSNIRDFLPINVLKILQGKIMFHDEKLSKTTEAYYFEPEQYSTITDIVEAMNTLINKETTTKTLASQSNLAG